jgi:hypothetical protein
MASHSGLMLFFYEFVLTYLEYAINSLLLRRDLRAAARRLLCTDIGNIFLVLKKTVMGMVVEVLMNQVLVHLSLIIFKLLRL